MGLRDLLSRSGASLLRIDEFARGTGAATGEHTVRSWHSAAGGEGGEPGVHEGADVGGGDGAAGIKVAGERGVLQAEEPEGDEGGDIGGGDLAVAVEVGGATGLEEEAADHAVVQALADDEAVVAQAVGGVEEPAG